MESAQVEQLLQNKHEAVRTFRTAEDETTKVRAWEAVDEASKAIDETVLELVRARESDEARAKYETVTHIDPALAEREEERRFNAEMRDMLRNGHGSISLRANEEMTTLTNDSQEYTYYNIATKLYDRLVYHRNSQSGVLRANPTIIRTAGDGAFDVPILLTDAGAAKTAEFVAATVTAPVFAKKTLNSWRIDGYMMVTDEMMRSPDYDFAAVINNVAARALATQEAVALARGGGTTEADGLFPTATAGVTFASQSDFTLDELLTLFYTPVEGVRANGTWLFSTPAMIKLATKKDGAGRYLWSPSVIAGEPSTLFGRPIIEEAHADANGTIATTEKHIVFGDINAGYWIRYAGNTDISISPHPLWTSYTQTVRFASWMDATVVEAASIYRGTQG
jgi:HK97 family phage major capsid protein